MSAWIKAYLAILLSPIGEQIRQIIARISGVWSTVTGFFARTRSALADARGKVLAAIKARIDYGLALLDTLKWIVTVYVPVKVRDAVNDARTWASDLVNRISAKLRALVDDLGRWARSAVDSLGNLLARLRDYALQRLGELKAFVDRLLDRVFGVLSTPDRLAEWAKVAIARSVGRYLRDNAVSLAHLVWSRRDVAVRYLISTLEAIAARII